MPNLLLHTCCAPCSTHAVELLKKEYDVTLFFSNSNIFPEEEYRKRLENAKTIAKIYSLNIIEDSYNHKDWLKHIKGLEQEPEKGKRCEKCFEFNLRRTADYAEKHNFDLFTTTLTISPHKDSETIFKIGKQIEKEMEKGIKIKFLAIDFKKQDGFKQSIALSNTHRLYRQNYCGCEFSKR